MHFIKPTSIFLDTDFRHWLKMKWEGALIEGPQWYLYTPQGGG